LSSIHDENKAALLPFREALYNFDKARARRAAAELFTPAAPVHLSHPFNRLTGQSAMLEAAILPLAQCLPDIERRDEIVIAGRSLSGQDWVGCCGHYIGTFMRPWMSIPATGHVAAVRYHEFFRFREGRVVEVQAIWDVADLMMQSGVWPMAPSLGREWMVPGPGSCDGLQVSGDGSPTLEVVRDMMGELNARIGQASGNEWEKFFHRRFNWYGPSGIGSCRGIDGYRRWSLEPMSKSIDPGTMNPDLGSLFAEGDYAAFSEWPGTKVKLKSGSWLGLAPSDQQLTFRTLRFWRLEDGQIRECWMLMDLLQIYAQVGIDVLGRLQDLTGQRILE